MKQFLPDVNVWFALSQVQHQHHGAAQAWLQGVHAPDKVAFCRPTQQGLLRLSSTAAIMALYGTGPITNVAAWRNYGVWLTDPVIEFADEPLHLGPAWEKFGAVRSASPKLWMDAYLAAFAVAGNFTLVTTDRAFKQFKGLDILVLG
ncbi:MAG: type II toxin-antitoxin system VapC family toxin [Bacteroidetes bacterium]|nr:type II toxin-antitoxin system VapC family toxin [Bacteroidota bacterium]